jgi:glycoprotein 3-alpha-L-fucosyltransferase
VRWAPKHSYIAVDQFESVKHLAAYLLKLIQNKTKYMQYFEWTKHYLADFDSTIVSPCQLCDYLHEAIKERKKKNYDDIDDWWNRGGQCRDPTFVTNLLNTG